MKNKMEVRGNIYVAGVYALETKEGKKLYIGSAIEINDALTRHLYNLKRNLYLKTNKKPLQLAYDREDLVFKVVHTSAYTNEVKNMNMDEKEQLQIALGVLEEFNIKLHRRTVCNVQNSVTKHSSNKDESSTFKRINANSGENNPRCKHDEDLVANILYLKERGFKPRHIVEMLLEHDVEVSGKYVGRIGVDRWIYLEGKCPDWYEGDVV